MTDQVQPESILRIKDLSVYFGGLGALLRCSIDVYRGEIRGVIGPNGAGKTTLFNVISRFYKPVEGEIRFEDLNLLSFKPHQIIKLGISRTFQKSDLFGSMSALENVQMGMHIHMKTNLLSASVHLRSMKEDERRSREEALKILEMLSLADYAKQPASVLPLGKQRLLEIGRAIASRPKLLLLDEPASGMTYAEKSELVDMLFRIREEMNLTLLLVEHDMRMVMRISDRLTVLNYGQIIAQGDPEQVRNDRLVIEAYLGSE
ncbi:MAG: ABC transporter ATP-binding protein [Pseudomonadota bacterium]